MSTIFGNNRDVLRRQFVAALDKSRAGTPLEPLEQQIVDVVEAHPEYLAVLTDESSVAREFHGALGEANPFLHLGLHIAIQEQLATDRPPGVRATYHRALLAGLDRHELEHRMMDCLAQTLWESQQRRGAPDEAAYLACLQRAF